MHMPEVHAPPETHGMPLVQHGCWLKPQDVHCGIPPVIDGAQITSAPVHMSPGQHGSSRLPQLEQVLVESQYTENDGLEGVQVAPGQHASKGWPQLVQFPDVPHTWAVEPSGAHRAFGATHVGDAAEMSQHPPPVH
jgi:hypothetical protein